MRRTMRWAIAGAVTALAVGGGACHAFGGRVVAWSDARQPRNAQTGLLTGAEPRDLGPVDADCAVLLVHGFLGCGNNFAKLPDRLAEQGCRVRVMLLPGHGTSPKDLARVSGAELTGAVLDEIDRLRPKHKRLILVGHSMGGTLCTLAASQREVDGLILAAPYFGVTGHWYYGLKPETWATVTGPVMPWLYKGRGLIQVNRREARGDIVSYRWVPSSSVKVLMGLARQANRPELLGNVSCPVLLIHSRNDEAASPAAAESAFARMAAKEKKAVWLEKSNHILFWDFDAETAMQLVCEECRVVQACFP